MLAGSGEDCRWTLSLATSPPHSSCSHRSLVPPSAWRTLPFPEAGPPPHPDTGPSRGSSSRRPYCIHSAAPAHCLSVGHHRHRCWVKRSHLAALVRHALVVPQAGRVSSGHRPLLLQSHLLIASKGSPSSLSGVMARGLDRATARPLRHRLPPRSQDLESDPSLGLGSVSGRALGLHSLHVG